MMIFKVFDLVATGVGLPPRGQSGVHLLPLSVVAGFLGLVVMGCSSNSGPSYGGSQCSVNRSKAFQVPSSAQKISLKTSDNTMPVGFYKLLNSEVFYLEKVDPANPKTWVMVTLLERPTGRIKTEGEVRTFETSMARGCVRGLSPASPSFAVEMNGLTEVGVRDDRQVLFKASKYFITWDQAKAKLEVASEALDELPTSPDEIFSGKVANFEFYKLVPDNREQTYQVLTQHMLTDKITVSYQASFVRTDLKQHSPPYVDLLDKLLKLNAIP